MRETFSVGVTEFSSLRPYNKSQYRWRYHRLRSSLGRNYRRLTWTTHKSILIIFSEQEKGKIARKKLWYLRGFTRCCVVSWGRLRLAGWSCDELNTSKISILAEKDENVMSERVRRKDINPTNGGTTAMLLKSVCDWGHWRGNLMMGFFGVVSTHCFCCCWAVENDGKWRLREKMLSWFFGLTAAHSL